MRQGKEPQPSRKERTVRYSNLAEAIHAEIATPINNGEDDVRNYDLLQIAIEVLGDYGDGYSLHVDDEGLWQAIQDNRKTFDLTITTDYFNNDLAIGWKIVSSIDETIAQGDFDPAVVFNEDTGDGFDGMTARVAEVSGYPLENDEDGAEWNDSARQMTWSVTINW